MGGGRGEEGTEVAMSIGRHPLLCRPLHQMMRSAGAAAAPPPVSPSYCVGWQMNLVTHGAVPRHSFITCKAHRLVPCAQCSTDKYSYNIHMNLPHSIWESCRLGGIPNHAPPSVNVRQRLPEDTEMLVPVTRQARERVNTSVVRCRRACRRDRGTRTQRTSWQKTLPVNADCS